jgi:hypothetical protein
MAENTQTFTLVGNFKDNITPKLKKLQTQIEKLNKSFTKDFSQGLKSIDKDFDRLSKSFDKTFAGASKGVKGLENSLGDAGRAAGKVRDTVSQIGEGIKGLDGISESLEAAARAAGRAQEEVMGIGEAAGRANRQADDLMSTLLKAEGLTRFGDAMSDGFSRGMGTIVGTAKKGAGVVAKTFTDAMQDELADVKAASGIQGSFGLAGFKGDYNDAEKMYKAYDRQVSEMIRTSAAPTAKVIELQRYTLDTMGPLMLAAQGVKKGTAMKDIDPKKIESSAVQYGQFLEKAALFSQGTGSAGFRVAAGIEGLVTRGKIDTTIDFFTDNIMLMKNLEQAGFAGRGMKSAKMMSATDAQRMAAMMEAFNKSMSSESTAAMAQSLTGSLQGLQDTIFNPSAGILGMAVTFTKKEQGNVNAAIQKVYDKRIAAYQKELQDVTIDERRKEQLRNDIAQATLTRDKLIKDGADKISTPFKAFSFAFTNLVQGLTNALSAIGPIWSQFAVGIIEFTDRVFGPLTETLRNVASDMRAGDVTQAQGFGRIVGEIFKTLGEMMADLARMLTDPKGAMGKIQSEFLQGFMEAFKEPGSFEKARQGIQDGLFAFLRKLSDVLLSVLSSEEARPFVLGALALAFGPPFVSAVIAGATPLLIHAIGKIALGLVGKGVTKLPKGVAGVGVGAAVKAGVAGQAANAAGVGAKLPGVAKAMAVAKNAKMKGVSTVAAGMIALATHAPQLAKAGKAVTTLGKRLPLLSVAFAGLDFAAKKAEGKSTMQAAAGAGGGLVGGMAGAAIGSAILPGAGTIAGGVLGSFIGDWIGTNIGPALEALPAKLSGMWSGFKNWIYNLPGQMITAIAYAQGYIEGAWARFSSWFMSLGPKFNAWLSNAYASINSAWTRFMWQLKAVFANPGKYFVGAAQSLGNAIGDAVRGAFNWAKSQLSNFGSWINQQKQDYARARAQGRTAAVGAAYGSPGVKFGSLGSAISYEMANKPPGSELVVANSSETIIPAAGGLDVGGGMKGMIDAIWKSSSNTANTISNGFTVLNNTFRTTQERSMQVTRTTAGQTTAAINRSIALSVQGDRQILSAIKAAAAAGGMGMGGGALGGGKGSLGAASALAQSMGLQITSGYRPGDPGYHGANRARDYSNGTGPTPQMMAFAQKMAATYGTSLTELIYTPLGFGIKNGKKVPPYAAAAHYNHVHVAFGRGPGSPTMFSNANAAMAYERMMAPAGATVATVTSNSSEWGNSPVTLNLTNNISGVQDPRTVAEMVWDYTSKKVQQLQNNSFA